LIKWLPQLGSKLQFKTNHRLAFFAALLAGLLSACGSAPTPAPDAGQGPSTATQAVPVVEAHVDAPPQAPREFRAAWVSTVANIDWPSRNNLTVIQQQTEALAILDRAKAMHLNAIVLQVRPSADALYASRIEPWSETLTGQQGQAPQPWYDPLAFWVNHAHARGLELHAWFNPYRAGMAATKSRLSREHIANTDPSLVKAYGKYLWMDPGEELAAKRTLDVVLDVVRRYDIDGVHIDDYFYPYPVDAPDNADPNVELEFPDQQSWQRYQHGGGKLDRASWRRQNVNRLIEAMYNGVHKEKSWVRFGISPFGIGRPDRRPAGIVGLSQYDKLYADAELWLEKGWLDYMSPQLYWPIAQAPQAYDVLLDYWVAQNRMGRHMWPGMFTSKVDKGFQPDEITQQISVTRSRAGATGHVHFSMGALMKGLGDNIKAGAYDNIALVPSTPWLGTQRPPVPSASLGKASGGRQLKLSGKDAVLFAVWLRSDGVWRFATVAASRPTLLLADAVTSVVISSVDRLGNESERINIGKLN
jgi:uncharacterized lipoprotein YddW (UPF0748 family)